VNWKTLAMTFENQGHNGSQGDPGLYRTLASSQALMKVTAVEVTPLL